ncbi:MAG: sulfurtransferase TusA family protein [Planctomycetota bacterium]|jgi:tRNA 2-thiouridine synthesizing protein A
MNDVEEERRTRELLADLERRQEHSCSACGRSLCAHAYVANVALGYRPAPLCVDCLALLFQRPRLDFLEHILGWIEARPCYSTGWGWAGQEEGCEGEPRPPCLWDEKARDTTAPAAVQARVGPVPHDVEWDAGDIGCGDLVLELRLRMQGLAPGQVLLLTATDVGAPTDLPAWCRLTGHRLAGQKHPRYWIEKGS